MILSDHIAKLIEQMLEDGGGTTEVRRNDLAAKIGCVPSQINYVITSQNQKNNTLATVIKTINTINPFKKSDVKKEDSQEESEERKED